MWSLANYPTPDLRSEAIIPIASDVQELSKSFFGCDHLQQTLNWKVISFTPDLSHLRLGSQIFSRSSSGNYKEVPSLHNLLEDSASQFEDIATRGSFLILAARQKKPMGTKHRNPDSIQTRKRPGKRNRNLAKQRQVREGTECVQCSRELSATDHGSDSSQAKKTSDSEWDSSEDSSSQSDTDSSEASNSAEESWSEGSTEASDCANHSSEAGEHSEDEESSRKQSDDESEAPVHSFGQLKEESDSDGDNFSFDSASSGDAYGGDTDHSEPDSIDFDTSDDDGPLRKAHSSRRTKACVDGRNGALLIYDLNSETPVQLFKFTHPLPFMLYQSSPDIHPTKPLVVWPLCRGEILFADIKGKTYFIRKARPTTKKSEPSHQ